MDRDPHYFTLEEVERIEDEADERLQAATDFVLFAFVAGAIIGALLGWLAADLSPRPAATDGFVQLGFALGQALRVVQ